MQLKNSKAMQLKNKKFTANIILIYLFLIISGCTGSSLLQAAFL